MSITYSSTIQNRIALKVWGVGNSSLAADQKALLDNTWTSGSLTGGVAYDALLRVNQYAQWFNQAGTTDAPAAWEQWFVAEASLRAIQTVRPDRVANFERERDDAVDAALDSFSLIDFSASTLGGTTYTVKAITAYIIDNCIRRRVAYGKDGERFRVFPSPATIHAEILWALNYVWNYTPWRFRRRQVNIRVLPITFSAGTWTESSKTLAAIDTSSYSLTAGDTLWITDGTGAMTGEYRIVTVPGSTSLTLASSLSSAATNLTTGDIEGTFFCVTIRGLASGETFDGLSTRSLHYVEATTSGDTAEWTDADKLASMRGLWQGNTGKPRNFCLERRGSSLVWLFAPYPDATYNFQAEAIIGGPPTPSDATDATPFTALPAEFRPVVRDVALARVLGRYAVPGASGEWQKAEESVRGLLETYETAGSPEGTVTNETRDVYGDTDALGCWGHMGGSL